MVLCALDIHINAYIKCTHINLLLQQPNGLTACQAPLSMGFSRQEYWSRLPFPAPGNLSDPGIKLLSPESSALQADSLQLSHQGGLLK